MQLQKQRSSRVRQVRCHKNVTWAVMPPSCVASQTDLRSVTFCAQNVGTGLQDTTQCALERHVHVRGAEQLADVRFLPVQRHSLQEVLGGHGGYDRAVAAEATPLDIGLGGPHQRQTTLDIIHRREQLLLG